MHFLIVLMTGAALLTASPDSTSRVTVKDATSYLRPEYQQLAHKLAISPASVPTNGNQFEKISAGPRYGELLFEDFRNASSLIELEIFLFAEDHDGIAARDILFDKVRQGVEVRYIYDNFGNFFDSAFDGRKVFTGFYRGLSMGGINMRSLTPLHRADPSLIRPECRDHRKIGIIDKRIAYVGGMNITSGSISGWGDTQLRITGPAVQCLRSVMLLNWNDLARNKAQRDELILEVAPDASPEGGSIIQVVPDGYDQPAFMMEEAITWLLDNAKEYIWFETPYFLPPHSIVKAMKRAAGRGVDVRLIVPIETDMSSFDPAFRSCFRECVEGGVRILYRKPPFNHSKTFLCDDYIMAVGSSNLDKISLWSLYEINVLVYDRAKALEQREYLEDVMDEAAEVDLELIDSWDSAELFKQSMLRIISPFL